MKKYKARSLLKYIFLVIATVILVTTPIMAGKRYFKPEAAKTDGLTVLTVWQIDSFEGGKGSRSVYLQSVGDGFYKDGGCYVKVTALTAEAVRENLNKKILPDLISYGAGTYGLESHFRGKNVFSTWCNGGYCFLTVNGNADFGDISAENTIINAGTDNLSGAAALLCGLENADKDKPTGAYVKLINGKYKYLLGTQRDIFRLRARGAAFKIKPINEFNDLYQNISITTENAGRQSLAQKFIDYLLEKSGGINKLGLMSEGQKLYDDEMGALEGLIYDCKLNVPVSERTKEEILAAIANCDVKKLKNLLN